MAGGRIYFNIRIRILVTTLKQGQNSCYIFFYSRQLLNIFNFFLMQLKT